MAPRRSIIPAAAVYDPALSALDIRVLTMIGAHTDRNWWCMLKAVTIAGRIGAHERSVRKSLKRLELGGYIETTRRRTHTEFIVNLDLDPDTVFDDLSEPDRAERPGVDRAEGPGVDRAERPGVDRAERPGVDRAERPGVDRAEGPGPYITDFSKRISFNEENSQSAAPPDDKFAKAMEQDEGFLAFWADYLHPANRGSKTGTWRTWNRLSVKDKRDAHASLAVWKQFYAVPANGWMQAPMAATFINGRRWDETPEPDAIGHEVKRQRPEWDRTVETTTALNNLNFDEEEA